MRILVLHGYTGNAAWTQRADRLLQRLLDPLGIALHYIDGPIRLPGSPVDALERRCSWWSAKKQGSWAACVEYIAGVFERDGPFDGVMGYSQGGACTAGLAALHAAGTLPVKLRFVVIACGFLPKDLAWAGNRQIWLPSMHVIGEADDTTPPWMNLRLASGFRDPTLVRHPGGHDMVVDGERGRAYLAFFARFATVQGQSGFDLNWELAGCEFCQSCGNWGAAAKGGSDVQAERWYCGGCWDEWRAPNARVQLWPASRLPWWTGTEWGALSQEWDADYHEVCGSCRKRMDSSRGRADSGGSWYCFSCWRRCDWRN